MPDLRSESPLAIKMVTIANRDGLPEDHPLRLRALELNKVKPEAKSILGAWARARRAYCDYTGEPLI